MDSFGASQVLLSLMFAASGVVNLVSGSFFGSSFILPDNQTMKANHSECEGLVLLSYNGTQSLVCDELWSPHSPLAYLVCHETGCGVPSSKWMGASFERPSLPTVQIHCKGGETNISECQQLRNYVGDCNEEHIATLTCTGNTVPRLDDDWNETVRLVGGRSKCDGHVEVLKEDGWGFLCSNALPPRKAHVLCKQIGCSAQQISLTSTRHSPCFERAVPVWSDDILCQGNESSLMECQWKANNSCTSGQHVYLHCLQGRLEESWIVWMTIIFAALMIVVFCWVRVIKSWKGFKHIVKKQGQRCHNFITKAWKTCHGSPTRRRRTIHREPPEVRVQESQSPPTTPLISPNVEDVNALLAPHGFCLNNTITPPPSYMKALKVLSKPLEPSQTPPPSYLEALRILSRPVIVHVPAATHAEEEELITSKPIEKQDQ